MSLATGHSAAPTPGGIARELYDQLGAEMRLVLFFASSQHDATALSAELSRSFPDSLVAGCSTMGEVGSLGLTTGAVSAFGLGPPCRVAAQVVEDAAGFQFADGLALIDAMAADLGAAALDPEAHVLVTLTDGLSGAEERLVAALGLAAPRISLVGGSAADDMQLVQTWVALDGQVFPSSSLILLVEPHQPFTAFQVHHFDPTDRRVVVTSVDPDRRVVNELNGFPAGEVAAELLGMTLEELRERPRILAEGTCFAYRVGDTSFLRAAMQLGEGDTLIMRGAVEEGVVLRVMRGGDLVERTREGLEEKLHEGAKGALLFNCGGRLLEARSQGIEGPLYEALSPIPVAGFSTYAEQFGSLLVNHTLTGLAIG